MTDAKATKQAERVARERGQRESDLKHLLSQPQGQRFVWDLLDRRCGLFGGSFRLESDGLLTAYNEGRRSLAIELVNELALVAPEQYGEMVRERTNHALSEARMRAAEVVPATGDRSTT